MKSRKREINWTTSKMLNVSLYSRRRLEANEIHHQVVIVVVVMVTHLKCSFQFNHTLDNMQVAQKKSTFYPVFLLFS